MVKWFLLFFFLLTFLSGSLMFVKWTHYIIPALPFIYILVFLFLLRLSRFVHPRAGGDPDLLSFDTLDSRLRGNEQRQTKNLLFVILFCLIFLSSLSFSLFFTSIYSFDTRIEAAKWAGKNLKPDVKILSEVYDMGIVPFNEVFHYSQIKLFNFYEMDDVFNDAANLAELKNSLNQFNVIVLPSGRITDTRLRLQKLYPNGNWFYKNLFAGNLGFQEVKSFSHSYDQILPGVIPDESFTVFDHPRVTIFVKK